MFAALDRRRATIVAAALVFSVVLIADLLLTGAAPGVGDEAEAQTVPYILGIPHPTGFPLYVLTGWLITHIVPFATVAWRLNAFMGLLTAACSAGVVLLAVALGADVIAAAFAGALFAFGGWVWYGSVHANAQPLGSTLSICALLACLEFARSGNRRFFIGACAACGFALATHPAAMFIAPALVAALAWQWRTITPRLVLTGVAVLLAPLLLYAYLPLRSFVVAGAGVDPTAHAPLFGSGSLDWDNDAPRTAGGFLDEVLGRHEAAGISLAHTLDAGILNHFAGIWYGFATHQFATLSLMLAALGALVLARVDLRALSVLAAGTLGGMIFSAVYRTDYHIDRYLTVSFAVTAALVAMCSRIRIPRVPALVPRTFCAVLLAGLVVRAVAINRVPTSASASTGDRVIAAVVASTPRNAIVVTQWDDAATLAYGAFVEHALGQRTVVLGSPTQFYASYAAWNAQRPVFVLNNNAVALPPGDAGLRDVSFPLPQYRLLRVPG